MSMLDYALQYAGRGWPIFRLQAGTKLPFKGSHGFKDATTDRDTIVRWWTETPEANIGMATGELVVPDADGPGGLEEARRVAGGRIPKTLAARTSRGWHFFYRRPPSAGELRTYNAPRAARGGDGLDIKASGGYVVLPPSINRKTGFRYQWANAAPILDLPECFAAYVREARKAKGALAVPSGDSIGLQMAEPRPDWLPPSAGELVEATLANLRRAELPSFLAALKLLPATCGYDAWYEIGAGIHDFAPDGAGLTIFKAWSWQSVGHRERIEAGDCERKWVEYDKPKPGRALITKSSIYFRAREIEEQKAREVLAANTLPDQENPPAAGKPDDQHVNGFNGVPALPAQITDTTQPIRFIDLDKNGNPRGTCTNARIAIRGFGIECRHNTFHRKLMVGGQPIDQWAGELSDDAVQMLRVLIHRDFGFDPGLANTHDAAVQECLQHGFDPVADYLIGLRWDGRARLAGWMATYLGAEDTPLNREIGRRALVAAARRVREPGAKFDQIIVLESPEGRGKSTALEILAGPDCFSDQAILTLDDRAQQEALQGVWIYEIADLAGHSKADIERVKAFASRRVDRARPAYGRARVDQPRRCVFFGTTNAETYLKSQTGNRRFWPVRVGRIDLDALARDRDQLWAEAAAIERTGESLALPEEFWPHVGAMQARRMDYDPWEDALVHMKSPEEYDAPNGGKEWRVPSKLVFDHWLELPKAQQTDSIAKRTGYILRRLGWDGPKVMRIGENVLKGYSKSVTG